MNDYFAQDYLMSSLNEDSSVENLKFDSDDLLLYNEDLCSFNETLAKDTTYEDMEFSPDVYFPVRENDCELTQMTSVEKTAHCNSMNMVAQDNFYLNSDRQDEASLFSYEASTNQNEEIKQVEENETSHFTCSKQQNITTEYSYLGGKYFDENITFEDNECSSSFENQQYFIENNLG